MTEWDAATDPEDERLIDEEAVIDLPDQLDRPVEAPEADTLEQAIEVPLEDEEHE